mgnify:FL=1
MKYLKWLWVASLVFFIGYFIKEYLENGFDSVLFATGIAILVSGVGFLNKKYVLYLILNNSGKEGVPAYELDLESK